MALLSNSFVAVIYAIIYFNSFASAECDKTKCPGPLAYYKALDCKPIYQQTGDCCAYKYDCDHLKNQKNDKCYVNGHEYNIGDKLKDEDANPCDIGCSCRVGHDGIATFNCAVVDCFHGPIKPGCYLKNSPLNCCPGEEVCRKSSTMIYKDGEYFQIDDNDKNCVCQPEYKGENIEPFCASPKRPYCDPQFRHAGDVKNNCVPVYYSTQSPQSSCSVFSRCQNKNDTIIKNKQPKENTGDNSNDLKCNFGNMTLDLGDSLNQATDYNSVCVKCICEIPPVLTCQRLPDEECDITKHPPFHSQF
ncbi:uncharacterized protein LOC122861174 isoform X2 [Aphidius gifuensis]|uniref:uncharacterized protein LOC122861174 isoform X2 n=1 Tax=Aphidius gifuensis TaxID=684658 RepID=UPI001CDD630C|nr:uncharacterized protein LOC122861174 isoform X2 [Aphidius gifuensis]